MSLTKFGLFKPKRTLNQHHYFLYASHLSEAIRDLCRQLQTLALDANHSQAVQTQIAGTKRQLGVIAVELDKGPVEIPALELIDKTPSSRKKHRNEQAHLNAEFLEAKVQRVVDLYNDLITRPEFAYTPDQSQPLFTQIRDIFAQFFNKIANIFRKSLGVWCEADIKPTSAQQNISGQFTKVRGLIDDVRNHKEDSIEPIKKLTNFSDTESESDFPVENNHFTPVL